MGSVPNQERSEPARIRATLDGPSRPGFCLRVKLDLPGQGITGVFGPSGSGKTTCLRALAGLERARGAVHVGDECWQDDERGVFLPTHRRAVGYVFQEANLFPHLSVHANLAYGSRRSRSGASLADFEATVELLAIGPLLGRAPTELSGGERQRVAIARCLLSGPRLLLMDEPLSSQDPGRKAELLPFLERLRDALSIPILYVSHSLEEVTRLSNHLVLLDGGRAIASGPTSDTLARLDLPIARLEDSAVVIEARIGAHDEVDQLTRLDFGDVSLWVGRVNRPQGSPARARVLARDVSVAREPPGRSSILNVLPAHVVDLRDDGPDRVIIRLAVGAQGTPLLARITRRSRDALGLEPGLAIYAMVKSVALAA